MLSALLFSDDGLVDDPQTWSCALCFTVVDNPGCGIRNLTIAWGHDEYAYLVIKNHTDKLRAAGAKEKDLIPGACGAQQLC